MKKEQRNELIQVRVTKEEKNKIQENADGNISSWLRSLGLNQIKAKRIIYTQDPFFLSEVKKIGNNLNQVAHYINFRKKSGEEIDLISIQANLVLINEQLNKLIKI